MWAIGVAVVLAGCGSTTRADPARQRFITDNDRICDSVARATLDALRETFSMPNGLPDVAAARRTGPQDVAEYRSALAQRERLTAPSADRARFQQHWVRYTKGA